MKKKILIAILLLTLSALTLSACSAGAYELAYYDGISADKSYNTDLFYRNDMTVTQAADPGCIYVSKEQSNEYGGYFYMYVTGLGFPVMRSSDMNNWEKLGNSLIVPEDSWFDSHFWAPEVIYNGFDGKYYMYFTSSSKIGNGDTEYSSSSDYQDRLYTGIAVSNTPIGPFIPWTGVNASGKEITDKIPPINFTKEMNLDYHIGAIDANPFFDDNGDLYLYFTRHRSSSYTKNEIWGIKMIDMVTPDYSTLSRLTEPGKYTPGGETYAYEASSVIDEAPNMIKHKGRYYLTYSPFGFSSRLYSVSVAVSTMPLSGFTKVSVENGNPVLGIDAYYDFMGGTGHHCFVQVDDELFSIYHGHMNRATGSGNPRGIAIDRLMFVYNKELGFDMLHANGPTYSLQPLPEKVSGYTNVAIGATITATNVKDANTVQYLNDGMVTFHDYDADKEFISKGKTKITINFDKPTEITAIMIYNSMNYDYAFSQIDNITFSFAEKEKGYNEKLYNKAQINGIKFNSDYVRQDDWYMRPGGSALAEFKPITVTQITIEISQKYTEKDYNGNTCKEIAISDIVVLGKAL